jgi:hypothetical protein
MAEFDVADADGQQPLSDSGIFEQLLGPSQFGDEIGNWVDGGTPARGFAFAFNLTEPGSWGRLTGILPDSAGLEFDLGNFAPALSVSAAGGSAVINYELASRAEALHLDTPLPHVGKVCTVTTTVKLGDGTAVLLRHSNAGHHPRLDSLFEAAGDSEVALRYADPAQRGAAEICWSSAGPRRGLSLATVAQHGPLALGLRALLCPAVDGEAAPTLAQPVACVAYTTKAVSACLSTCAPRLPSAPPSLSPL